MESNIQANGVKTISANDNSNNLEKLTIQLKDLESQLIPQLDDIASKLPEIYQGYAKVVREITSQILETCQFSSYNAKKIALAAEISARIIECYGSMKAAKDHNRMLAKFLNVKQEIARVNESKISRLLSESDKNVSSLKKLLELQLKKVCSFSDVSIGNMPRVAALQLRVLNLYRTSLFLNKLAYYLNFEYEAWLKGEQTCGLPMPDYFTVNEHIVNDLWGKGRESVFNALVQAADAEESLVGKDIILLADQQLFTYAISDEICNVDIEKAAPHVSQLLSLHSGITKHLEDSAPFRTHIDDSPMAVTYIICVLSALASIAMGIWMVPGNLLVKCLVITVACCAIIKIDKSSNRKIREIYFVKGDELMMNYIDTSQKTCGKVDDVEIDYEEKNVWEEGLKGFLS